MSAFPFGRVAGAAALGGLEIPHVQRQLQIVLLAPHQDGTKQGRRCSQSNWFLNDIWVTSHGFSQQELLHQSFVWHSGSMVELT